MKISSLYIKNFKSIRELHIEDMEQALILVGKNNTGKTVILDAVLAMTGNYEIEKQDYNQSNRPIIIGGVLRLDEEDLQSLHKRGLVSKYRNYSVWLKDFETKLPSYQNGDLALECRIGPDGKKMYADGVKQHNRWICQLFPKIYFIDYNRNIASIQEDVLSFMGNDSMEDLREGCCIFDRSKTCIHCYQCIGLINQKKPEELSIHETARLMEYKLVHMNLNSFADKLNQKFQKNCGGFQEIQYNVEIDTDQMYRISTEVYNKERNILGPIEHLGAGFKSIYILSLLETYIEERDHNVACIILMEDPEIFLHPQLQKTASEILYRLSKKNQVIFSTHSPNMIFNFTGKQIRQIVLDEHYQIAAKPEADIDEILEDLGYTANDLMNVNFVFLVEGKQDSSRLPMLLEKYYSETYDDKGMLQRIAIIPVNSCTNIKTYANLKYMNKLYLKDQFLMIRDGDGKDPVFLQNQLCHYYHDRNVQDENNLPRVMPRNVLILKYYSFENYFLEPLVMVKAGILEKEEDFYEILYCKYEEYLYKLSSVKAMQEKTGILIREKQDLKDHMEEIKIYVRGHNLFDIFYGRYKGEQKDEIIKRYINEAPRETFEDILKAIDHFIYFENRRKDVE